MTVVDAVQLRATTTRPGIPFSRLLRVELRKMFDTRSGAWLLLGIGLLALAATAAVVLFAEVDDLAYSAFGAAVGVPMAVLLPVVAVLSVTGEWSQRTGLVTFALVPQRGRVIGAKAAASVLVGVASMLVAFVLGALGNLLGSAVAGVDPVWDMSASDLLLVVVANVLGLLVGFMLGVLLRSSAAALVAYFVYAFVLPGVLGVLAASQAWFADVRSWVDVNAAQAALFDAPVTGEQWAQLGVSGLFWLVLPLAVGLRTVLRSEVA